MAVINKKKGYRWDFENIGGTLRVCIVSGEDIAHLEELDPKMWTVLSCPVKGLEIDEKSLAYMDCDSDGKIRINDVICTSRWITSALRNPDVLLGCKDYFDIENFNQETELGKMLYLSSSQILANLGKEGTIISLVEAADIASIFSKTRFNGDGVITEASAEDAEDKAALSAAVASFGGVLDRSGALGVDESVVEAFYKALADYASWYDSAVEAPFGDKTQEAIAAYNALDAKVRDFFMRSRLAAFSPDSKDVLDVRPSLIETISAENLTGKTEEIAAYPIARVTGQAEISLTEPVNPAWAPQFNALKSIVFEPGTKVFTEDDWNQIGLRFAAYSSWKNSKAGGEVESLGIDEIRKLLLQDRRQSLLDLIAQDNALKAEADNIILVDKFLHLNRDFYRLLRNFVTLNDFYDKDKRVKAIFQSGRLIIDQRECSFCMTVTDMGKHNTMAPTSGMFLVYCDCTTKTSPAKIQIVAAVTVGDIGDLIVGKNAVYYDNSGLEWDAVITKVVDNPISVAQAFWSPYRRMAKAVENLISKSAADKDAKIINEATLKINSVPASAPAAVEATPAAPQPFDIGKFAGIFAALGMAVGMIGSALASLAKGIFALTWWQVILAFVGVLLIISGPAMIMAWMKLRRRNIAPLLNANGWAVNASSKISIPFGETLTDIARFPKMKLKDPYAKKGLAPWKKWLISVSGLIVLIAVLWLVNLFAWAGYRSPISRYNQPDPIEEVADTLTVQAQ